MDEDELLKKLQWDVTNGELCEVQKVLKDKKSLVAKKLQGRTPLHYAADYGQKDVAECLINNGAPIDEKDQHGITPLLNAIMEKHEETVKLLLAKGAQKTGEYGGKTYLEWAETEGIKKLLQ